MGGCLVQRHILDTLVLVTVLCSWLRPRHRRGCPTARRLRRYCMNSKNTCLVNESENRRSQGSDSVTRMHSVFCPPRAGGQVPRAVDYDLPGPQHVQTLEQQFMSLSSFCVLFYLHLKQNDIHKPRANYIARLYKIGRASCRERV